MRDIGFPFKKKRTPSSINRIQQALQQIHQKHIPTNRNLVTIGVVIVLTSMLFTIPIKLNSPLSRSSRLDRPAVTILGTEVRPGAMMHNANSKKQHLQQLQVAPFIFKTLRYQHTVQPTNPRIQFVEF